MMGEFTPQRSWVRKFANAFRGVGAAVRGQSSFHAHVPLALAVITLAVVLGVSRVEWCLLILCITIVTAAETFNSALETMATAIDREYNRTLGTALDMASGAVLVSAIGASSVGVLILGYHLAKWLAWI